MNNDLISRKSLIAELEKMVRQAEILNPGGGVGDYRKRTDGF